MIIAIITLILGLLLAILIMVKPFTAKNKKLKPYLYVIAVILIIVGIILLLPKDAIDIKIDPENPAMLNITEEPPSFNLVDGSTVEIKEPSLFIDPNILTDGNILSSDGTVEPDMSGNSFSVEQPLENNMINVSQSWDVADAAIQPLENNMINVSQSWDVADAAIQPLENNMINVSNTYPINSYSKTISTGSNAMASISDSTQNLRLLGQENMGSPLELKQDQLDMSIDSQINNRYNSTQNNLSLMKKPQTMISYQKPPFKKTLSTKQGNNKKLVSFKKKIFETRRSNRTMG